MRVPSISHDCMLHVQAMQRKPVSKLGPLSHNQEMAAFTQCYSELVERGGHRALSAVATWEQRPGFSEVVSFVKGFDHNALYSLTTDHVRQVIGTTDHALGDVRKEEQIASVENFTCPFALHHLFHRLIERTGELPTWQRFWRWMERQARDKWLDIALQEGTAHGIAMRPLERAIQWRVGKFYYSALREVDLLLSVREMGHDLKYHLLADVLLRADFWCEDTIVCTFFPNSVYREGQRGRKPPASVFLGAAEPPFRILDFPVERQGYGRLWLVSDKSKRSLSEALRRGAP